MKSVSGAVCVWLDPWGRAHAHRLHTQETIAVYTRSCAHMLVHQSSMWRQNADKLQLLASAQTIDLYG